MNNFFCSDYSRQTGEDLIGSATNYQTYILVECPPPWISETFSSQWVPDNLRVLVEEVKRAHLPIRFLLIANDESSKTNYTTLLLYQKPEGLGTGYQKQEFHLENIEQVAGVVRKWLWGGYAKHQVKTSTARDILVCTHGSQDKCCAKYGNPFYFYGKNTIANLLMHDVRIWKSTHFGGHRFAPTAIDLPAARYYGLLDQHSFSSILTRTGDIQCLRKVYRGWGILPTALQIVERELILNYGWDWFNYRVGGKILQQSLDNNTILGEITLEQPCGSLHTYRATLVKDQVKTQKVRCSCNTTRETEVLKYAITNIELTSKKLVTLSNI
jgi:hypothetical protein